jgi:hypothetical protein
MHVFYAKNPRVHIITNTLESGHQIERGMPSNFELRFPPQPPAAETHAQTPSLKQGMLMLIKDEVYKIVDISIYRVSPP